MKQSSYKHSGKLPIEVDMNDIPKESILPQTTKFPPPRSSKMKENISDSHLPWHHQRTLPTKSKQTSDSRLINYQHEHHTLCTRDTLPLELAEVVQESTIPALTSTLDSESMPPPLPPKPTAT